MNTQEKIQELALAALRAGPPPAGIPKPVTFMPGGERRSVPAGIPTAVPPNAAGVPSQKPANGFAGEWRRSDLRGEK